MSDSAPRRYDRKTKRALKIGEFVCARRWTRDFGFFTGRISAISGDTITVRLIGQTLDGKEYDLYRSIDVPHHLIRCPRG
jgi:hypothetical protein